MTQSKARKPLTARRLRQDRRYAGVLYKLVRARLGLTQERMGDLLGCSRFGILHRERTKQLYSLQELVALQELTGIPDADWWDIIKEVAK